MLVRTLVPLFLISFSSPVLASTSLTLDQALKDFDKSPQIAKAASAAEEASWKRVEAFGGFLPTISATAMHLLDKKYALLDVPGFAFSIPQIIPTTTYTVTATWTVFDGLANWNHFQSARDMERASAHDSEWAKFTGRRDVILSFYRALATHTLNEVARQNLKALEDHLQNSRLFRKAGLNTKFDVLQVEVQTSKARSDARNAADAEVVSQLRLGELLGQDVRDRTVEGAPPRRARAARDGRRRDRSAPGGRAALRAAAIPFEASGALCPRVGAPARGCLRAHRARVALAHDDARRGPSGARARDAALPRRGRRARARREARRLEARAARHVCALASDAAGSATRRNSAASSRSMKTRVKTR